MAAHRRPSGASGRRAGCGNALEVAGRVGAGDPLATAVWAEAVSVLERSCRDCHSNETTWPWYSSVAPVSWLVARDVNEGRKELNISEFGTYEPKKQQHKLEEACTQVKEGEMPMWIYVIQRAHV